jgi:hypothetical protein
VWACRSGSARFSIALGEVLVPTENNQRAPLRARDRAWQPAVRCVVPAESLHAMNEVFVTQIDLAAQGRLPERQASSASAPATKAR